MVQRGRLFSAAHAPTTAPMAQARYERLVCEVIADVRHTEWRPRAAAQDQYAPATSMISRLTRRGKTVRPKWRLESCSLARTENSRYERLHHEDQDQCSRRPGGSHAIAYGKCRPGQRRHVMLPGQRPAPSRSRATDDIIYACRAESRTPHLAHYRPPYRICRSPSLPRFVLSSRVGRWPFCWFCACTRAVRLRGFSRESV